jgi:nucleoside-diphosphate-sugar epimerase
MKKVLVTGANGFLGRALMKELLKEKDSILYAVVSGKREVFFEDTIKVLTLDLMDFHKTKEVMMEIKPHVCIHLAWDQTDGNFRNSDTNLSWLSASLNLLEAFQRAGGERFIFAGTSSEYDGCNGLMMEDEAVKSVPLSMYGQCKKAFTEIALNYAKLHGISVGIARYFTIYGENDPHFFGAIPSTIHNFLQNKEVICQSPLTIRDYIYVEDAARATVLLLKSDYTGAVNIASGIPHAMGDVFSMIARIMECSHLLTLAEDAPCGQILVGDTTKLKKNLSFECNVSFEEGIKRTIAWWKANDRRWSR